jgi:general secretion pathway protein F
MLREIRSALSYPVFLLVAAVVTVLLVVGLILPRFASIYSPEELRQLPMVSQLTLSFGGWIHGHPLLVLVFFVTAAGGVIFVAGSRHLSRLFLEAGCRLPLIHDAALFLDFARLFAALGTMLGSGVTLSRAVRLCERVAGHAGLRKILQETGEELKKGQKLSDTWRRHALIPNEVVALTAVGETGACLDEIFQRTGRKYMALFKNRVAMLLTFLEPAIIAILGIFIGFIVISIMLAVVSMSDLYG